MKSILFLDTETTGNDLAKDRLCQVAWQLRGSSEMVAELFKPTIPIGIKSMSITNITNKMVADSPSFQGSKTYTDLQELLNTHILVAHNAPFDIKMLEHEGITIPYSIDTLRLARHLDEQGTIPEYGLQYLRYFLDLDIADPEAIAHSADGDVLVLAALFERLLSKVTKSTTSEDEAIERLCELSKTPVMIKKFSFGKHIGRSLADVASDSPDYLQWLLRQKLEDPEGEEDWIHTLQHYLK